MRQRGSSRCDFGATVSVQDRQLFLGTVHGFCLTRIIRPYARVTGAADLAERVVLSMPRRRALIERALEVEGVTENPTYFDPTLSTIRKALACDETLEPYDPPTSVSAGATNNC